MFADDTVIILGAGASCGYGYPLGHNLIDDMIKVSEGWASGNDGADAERYGRRIRELLKFYDPVSIDSFLYHYEHDPHLVEWAKVCIGEVLLSYADLSKFNRGVTNSENWYRLLWNAIVSGVKVDDLVNPLIPLKLNIVTFNYDASLEAFLYSRVTQDYSIFHTDGHKQAFLKKLSSTIHHVYGCLMDYKWQGGDDHNTLYQIKDRNERGTYALRAREKIVLINDREEASYDSIQKCIIEAEQVIFLGFGFDDLNVGSKVLNLQKTLSPRDGEFQSVWSPLIKYTNFNDSVSSVNYLVRFVLPHEKVKLVRNSQP